MDFASRGPCREHGIDVEEPMLQIGGATEGQDVVSRIGERTQSRPVEVLIAVVGDFFHARRRQRGLSLLRISFVRELAEPSENERIVGMKFGPRAECGKLKRRQIGSGFEDQLPQACEAFAL